MQITGLPQSGAFTGTDVLAIEINGVTYKLDGATLATAITSIGSLVTGVKGNNESTYRTGNVNITPANIGALVPSDVDNRAFKFLLSASGTSTTWADVYNKLKSLSTFDTATFFASGGAASLLTGGAVTSTMKGIVAYNGSGTYDFLAFAGLGPYSYGWRVTTLTGTTAGTVGTVYRYAGVDTYTTGTITRHSNTGSSGTFEQYNCYRLGDTVTACARLYGVSLAASGSFFQLPSGFRPRATTYGYSFMVIDGVYMPFVCNINTSGVVNIGYSSNKTLTSIYFQATFPA